MTDTRFQFLGDQTGLWHKEFIENIPVGIYRSTLEGRLVFCNTSYSTTAAICQADIDTGAMLRVLFRMISASL